VKAPQIIAIALMCIYLGTRIALHGKDRGGKHHAGYALFDCLLWAGLLYWGGFFDAR